MLEAFLETVCEHEKRASADRQNLELLSHLPTEELFKIAGGATLKQAFMYDGGGDWLEKYKDTPLLQDAIALEKESLNIEMEEQSKRRESSALYEESSARRDELCIKKKLLDLQLAEAESGGGAEEAIEEEVEAPPPPAPEQVEQAANAVQPPPDLAKAAMAMRFSLAKEALDLSSATKSVGKVVGRAGELLSGSKARLGAFAERAAAHEGKSQIAGMAPGVRMQRYAQRLEGANLHHDMRYRDRKSVV